jgi:ferredoxin
MANHRVQLSSTNVEFEVEPNEIILDAAIRQGIQIPYSCRSGTCRSCLFQVVCGEVIQEDRDIILLTDLEWSDNRRLLCTSRLQSNAVLEKPRRRSKNEG